MASGTVPDPEHLLQHAAFVRAVARATLRGDDLVDDVVQETWVAALERGRGRRGPLAPWLAGVVRNQARNLLRRRAASQRRERAASRPESVSPEQEVVDRLEVERRLIEAVDALPEHYRTPLVLRYLADLPPRVIAVRLDLPVETVRTRVRRGLERLRLGLEERHGGEARDWRLALLPLLDRGSSSAPAVVAASGGLLMTKKLLVAVGALVLLAGGATLVGRALSRPQAPTESDGVEVVRESQGHSAAPPALVGRSEVPDTSRGSAPDALPPAVPTRTEESPAAVDRTKMGDAMHALLGDIRRDVAPEWWGGHPVLAALEGRNGVVIARAPPDVLDAIARYLDARRKGDLSGVEEAPRPDVRALDTTRAALRPVLRGILDREHKLGLAVEAWEQGHLAEARARAGDVLTEEPDNELAADVRRGAVENARSHDASGSTEGGLDRTRRRFQDLHRQQTLRDWVMRWPSVGTWEALRLNLQGTGLFEFRRLAPDLDGLLDQGSVTIDVADASLHYVVRRIQVETFADIRFSKGVEGEVGPLRVVDFHEEARPLRRILDELVRRLPEGWTWFAARQYVVIARAGGEGATEPETRLRYFDVKDILVPGSVPPEVQTLEAPKTPPVYRSDPNGGPPVLVEDEPSGGRSSR